MAEVKRTNGKTDALRPEPDQTSSGVPFLNLGEKVEESLWQSR